MYIIQCIKTSTKAWETFILMEAERDEEAYVDKPTDDTKRAWLDSQSMSRQVELQLAKNKCFFLQQKHYEEGDNTGHMLAMLIRNQCSAHIDKLYDSQGCLRNSTQDILQVFCTFYNDLYSSKVHSTGSKIAQFLDECSLPSLSAQEAKLFNDPITEEELLLALKQAPNGKSPGTLSWTSI